MTRLIFALFGLCLPLLAAAIPEGPEYPSAEWTQRETQNFAKTLEAPTEQVANPQFTARWIQQSTANTTSYLNRAVTDPSWLVAAPAILQDILSGTPQSLFDPATLQQRIEQLQQDPAAALAISLDSPLTPLCATWGLPCTGDPFRYPEAAGADGADFYATEAIVTPVVLYDRGCARISGRVWQPRNVEAGRRLPGVVIQNGSIQAPETLYWWAAQMLVRNGYVVMTFDPRGQGRSDWQTQSGEQGSNLNPAVFWTGLVDAIDFFRSTPETLYPHNERCAGTYQTAVTAYDPAHAVIDPERLGIAGHSLGAQGVSVVQGYGAPGAEPWPGLLDEANPVDVAVAWDALVAPGGEILDPTNVPGLDEVLGAVGNSAEMPDFGARVPAMGQSSEYGLAPFPFAEPPDPEAHKAAFDAWRTAGTPVFQLTIQGSTHYEWSQLPTFPATSWCPELVDGACSGGWGSPMMQHYTLAWLDRWLKRPGEPGYATADARLLDDDGPQGRDKMSFYFRSARDFPTRDGERAVCGDIRAGCDGGGGTGNAGQSTSGNDAGSGGGCTLGAGGPFDPAWLLLIAAAVGGLVRGLARAPVSQAGGSAG